MQNKNKNIRVTVLAILAVLSGLLYFFVASPWSPTGLANVCEDVDYAKQQYQNKDIKKRNKFINERNDHCKILLTERKHARGVYQKIDNCVLLDYAVDASDKYIDLQKGTHPKAVKENIEFFLKNLDNYNYCPQYGDVANKFKKLEQTYN